MIVAVLIIVLFRQGCEIRESQKQYEQNYDALNSSLTKYRNKYGQEVVKAKVLETTSLEQIEKFAELDSSIAQLKKVVKEQSKLLKDGGMATVINNHTYLQGRGDTIIIDSTGAYYSPISQFGDWVTGYHMISPDSSYIDMKIKNQFSLAFGYEREPGFKNWFKPKKPVAYLTNKNPYTYTDDLRIVNIESKSKKLGLNIGIGATWGITPSFETDLVLGITLSKPLIEL